LTLRVVEGEGARIAVAFAVGEVPFRQLLTVQGRDRVHAPDVDGEHVEVLPRVLGDVVHGDVDLNELVAVGAALLAGIDDEPLLAGGDGLRILKAEVMARRDNPRFVVTSLDLPNPECVSRDLCCARGQDENFIKRIKNDLASDRTSDSSFLANQMRPFWSCAAYTLHQTLRTEVLAGTELANAQPSTGP